MAASMQTTVERLDRPSAYYLGRVRVAEMTLKLHHSAPIRYELIILFNSEQEAEV